MARATGGRQSVRRIQDFLAQQSAVTGGRVRTTPALEAYLTAELEAEKTLSIQQESLAESKRVTKENEAFRARQEITQAEQFAEQQKAAEIQGGIQIVEVGATSALALKELGIIGGASASTTGAAAPPALSAIGAEAGVTSTVGATNAPTITSATATSVPSGTTGATAGGGEAAGGVSGVGLGIAAVVIADAYIAESAAGGFETWEERQALNIKGFEYGPALGTPGFGISPGAAATLERWGIKSPADIVSEAVGTDIMKPLADLQVQIEEAIGNEFLNDVNTFLSETFGL